MESKIYDSKHAMGAAAAACAADALRAALAARGEARVILATGASQFEMLDALVQEDVDWSRVTCFHLDEYVGLPESHAASFRRYLRERFVDRVGEVAAFHFISGEGDAQAECERVGTLIAEGPIDVACVGIGENGHLAFNDPPADFETEVPYIVVDLDEACRRQQLGEGWFPTLDDVPRQAISMTCRQIMKARTIVCTVPDARKAEAVRGTLEEPVSNRVPATILREHAACTLFLDAAAASRLRRAAGE